MTVRLMVFDCHARGSMGVCHEILSSSNGLGRTMKVFTIDCMGRYINLHLHVSFPV